MADNAEYLEDRKFILESLKEHKDNIKTLFNNDTDIKLALNTLIVKMAVIVFIGSSVTGTIVAIIFKEIQK
jgi:hypothetical protein